MDHQKLIAQPPRIIPYFKRMLTINATVYQHVNRSIMMLILHKLTMISLTIIQNQVFNQNFLIKSKNSIVFRKIFYSEIFIFSTAFFKLKIQPCGNVIQRRAIYTIATYRILYSNKFSCQFGWFSRSIFRRISFEFH